MAAAKVPHVSLKGMTVRMSRITALSLVTICCFLFAAQYRHLFIFNRALDIAPVPLQLGPSHDTLTNTSRVTLVASSQTSDDTLWLRNSFPEWRVAVYVADDPGAEYAVPANKGREAMAYLTYIIDSYDELSEVTIFQHANQYQWHNDDPLYDGERALKRLQIDHVVREGFVNLRCVWILGCPPALDPLTAQDEAPAEDGNFPFERHYKKAFEELFPGIPVPEHVGTSCCAQFAVTARTIRARPKSDYQRYRRWLLGTDITDELSGRIFEYLWHIMFGKNAVFCPLAEECYCKVYGLCNLTCHKSGVCDSQYTMPPYLGLPEGWPHLDWKGDHQDLVSIRARQELDFVPELRHYWDGA